MIQYRQTKNSKLKRLAKMFEAVIKQDGRELTNV